MPSDPREGDVEKMRDFKEIVFGSSGQGKKRVLLL